MQGRFIQNADRKDAHADYVCVTLSGSKSPKLFFLSNFQLNKLWTRSYTSIVSGVSCPAAIFQNAGIPLFLWGGMCEVILNDLEVMCVLCCVSERGFKIHLAISLSHSLD